MPAQALLEQPNKEQAEREREIEAVVRNKGYFKRGRVEIGTNVSIDPFNSAASYLFAGARATWHFADAYAWELLDFKLGLRSVSETATSFTTNLVTSKGLSNVQVTGVSKIFGTSFLMSPIYGKFRLFGATVVYYDIYGVVGAGLADTSTIMVSAASTGAASTQTVLRTGFDPMVNAGVGLKFYIGNFGTLGMELRDYMLFTDNYGKKTLKNVFTVGLSLSFFIPTF